MKPQPGNFPIQAAMPIPERGSLQRCRFTGSGFEFDAVVYDITQENVGLRPTNPLPENWRSMGSVEFINPASKEQS